ncbi:metallophosphoesterase family protein [Amycolatopsis sp. PS_44_ISF1]|uniref:metallophosphoesterase family protein n=1 Tax=Amycolatopsis sp. PS_44_ISF1 TaxID=2974917 RepID=UPI0028DE41BB|nr:metallophosphoesterase family protein [Amycolatopsis sp. PS_44_ISF1]MDT8914036.1 metallophosphatase family protein [Amycolatopsis sp. PS_44_ISF1]
MFSSVAVLSDIHGVLPALEAVLAEPDVRTAEAVVLCGDHAAGPLPSATLDRLSALGDRAVWVRGNADRELVTLAGGGPAAGPDPIAPWAAAQLRAGQLAMLAGLPLTVTLEVEGLGEVLFCHATPRDDEEVVLVDSPLPRWAEVLDGVTAPTVVCGHTHMPFTRLADRRLIVNPGSVGIPYGTAGAHWARLGPGVELRRTPYDAEQACRRLVAESGYEDIEEFADYFVRNPASDAEALRVFSPRARGTSAT